MDFAPALAHFGVELSGLGLEDFPFEVRRKLLRPAFTKLPQNNTTRAPRSTLLVGILLIFGNNSNCIKWKKKMKRLAC